MKDQIDIINELQKDKFRIGNYFDPKDSTKRLSEKKLAKIISTKYSAFDQFYDFCCSFVHFSRKAIFSTIKFQSDKMHLTMDVGNYDMLSDVMTNANSLIELNKVLASLVQDCFSNLSKQTSEIDGENEK